MMPSPSTVTTALVGLFLSAHIIPGVFAGVYFAYSCPNYYLGNGNSDHSGAFYLEAWCDGGVDEFDEARPGLCTRLNISDCYKNSNGVLEPYSDNEIRSDDLLDSCDVDSCAMRQPWWDGPILSCYCRDLSGKWALTEVNLNDHIGNDGGYLNCGYVEGTLDCAYPWTPDPPPTQEDEEELK